MKFNQSKERFAFGKYAYWLSGREQSDTALYESGINLTIHKTFHKVSVNTQIHQWLLQ